MYVWAAILNPSMIPWLVSTHLVSGLDRTTHRVARYAIAGALWKPYLSASSCAAAKDVEDDDEEESVVVAVVAASAYSEKATSASRSM